MKFQIEKVILWPRLVAEPPRILSFALSTVNVISGNSRTGKSAIIPIIDYCLGSSECLIPIDTIRDTVAWFGIMVDVGTGKFLLARKGPEEGVASLEYYADFGTNPDIPKTSPLRNESLDGIKEMLNSRAGLSSLGRKEREFDDRLSFRDVCHLVFQSQDVVANQSVLFYKGHELKCRMKLQEWFPYLLGIKSTDDLLIERQIHDIEERKVNLQREQSRLADSAKRQVQQVSGWLNRARQLGLYDGDIPKGASLDELVDMGRRIVENPVVSPNVNSEAFRKAEEELRIVDEAMDALNLEIAEIRQRIGQIESLRKTRTDYGGVLQTKIDRIGISGWIEKLFEAPESCPFCGSSEHPVAKHEIGEIQKAVAEYRVSMSGTTPLYRSFDKEYAALKRLCREKKDELDSLEKRADVATRNNAVLKKTETTIRRRWELLGELKSRLALYETYSKDENIEKELMSLDAELASLRKKLPSNREIQIRRADVDARLSQLILNRLATLDADPKYSEIPPRFSYRDSTILVRGSDKAEHVLAEIGSASNWVSFHLALVCAWQEFFCRMQNQESPIPSFVVFDQPSQVYFPHGYTDDKAFRDIATDEDSIAVKKMFETISQSIRETGGAWQAIILEHADGSVYGDVEGVQEVENWRDERKLIPESWIPTNEIKN